LKPDNDPDVQLMLALQQGDLSAFDVLFRKHVAGVVRFARRFVRSEARAEELAQDVFLQLYKTRDRYEPRARFKTWLFRMVNNACLSELRSADHRRRSDPAAAGGDPDVALEAVMRSTPSSEHDALDAEAVGAIRNAVGRLPEQQRAALLLARSEGLSYDEVAETLGCSVSAVKSLIHRATVTLAARLHDDGSET
jgi:RNA polymerase sigma-70 factor (ECF subfamily)